VNKLLCNKLINYSSVIRPPSCFRKLRNMKIKIFLSLNSIYSITAVLVVKLNVVDQNFPLFSLGKQTTPLTKTFSLEGEEAQNRGEKLSYKLGATGGGSCARFRFQILGG